MTHGRRWWTRFVAALGVVACAGDARAGAGLPSAKAIVSYCSAEAAFGQPIGGRGLKGRGVVPGPYQNWSDAGSQFRPFDRFSATLTEKSGRLIGVDATRGYDDANESREAFLALSGALQNSGLFDVRPSDDQGGSAATYDVTFVSKSDPGAIEIEVSDVIGKYDSLVEMNCRSPKLFPDALKEALGSSH
jgi:hypothetical protein